MACRLAASAALLPMLGERDASVRDAAAVGCAARPELGMALIRLLARRLVEQW